MVSALRIAHRNDPQALPLLFSLLEFHLLRARTVYDLLGEDKMPTDASPTVLQDNPPLLGAAYNFNADRRTVRAVRRVKPLDDDKIRKAQATFQRSGDGTPRAAPPAPQSGATAPRKADDPSVDTPVDPCTKVYARVKNRAYVMFFFCPRHGHCWGEFPFVFCPQSFKLFSIPVCH